MGGGAACVGAFGIAWDGMGVKGKWPGRVSFAREFSCVRQRLSWNLPSLAKVNLIKKTWIRDMFRVWISIPAWDGMGMRLPDGL
jgi:hypothetical protein